MNISSVVPDASSPLSLEPYLGTWILVSSFTDERPDAFASTAGTGHPLRVLSD
jgi:hypothetical protein